MSKKTTKRDAITLGTKVAQSLAASGLITAEQAANAKIIFKGHKSRARPERPEAKTPNKKWKRFSHHPAKKH